MKKRPPEEAPLFPVTSTAPFQSGRRGIRRNTEAGPAPLSFAQERLYLLDQLYPNSSAYNMTQIILLKGSLDVGLLERALKEVRQRHEVLRTNFDSANDQLVQVVTSFRPLHLSVADFSDLCGHRLERACRDAIQAQTNRPFDLKHDDLLRACLLRLRTSEHLLVLTLHHIVFDGWSTRLLMEETARLYEAFSLGKNLLLPELPIQYSDYARWQHEWVRDAAFEKQLDYWRRHLGGNLPVLQLPTDRPRPKVQTFAGSVAKRIFSPELTQLVTLVGQRRNATFFMTLLAAFTVLLHRLSGQDEIVVGVPVAGRTPWETQKLIGLFLNTLALRIDLSGRPKFHLLLEQIRSVTLDGINHQDIPFEKVVEGLQPPRDLSRTPLFQVMLNAFLLDDPEIHVPGLTMENVTPPENGSKFDLTLYVLKTSKDTRLELVYNPDLFDAARMEEMLDQFLYLLQQIAAEPDKPIGSYSLVTEKSSRILPDPVAALEEPRFPCVVEMFWDRVKELPEQKAVTQKGRSWTYAELSACAEAVARTLLSTGLRRGDVVAVTGPRSFGLIASIVGVFMSGGVLLAIDPQLPAGRRRLLLAEARAGYLVYIGDWQQEDGWLRALPGLRIVNVETSGRDFAAGGPTLAGSSADDPAYIFFTSGITGIPKGILGRQKSLSHFLTWQKETFCIGSRDRSAQLTNLSFDVVLRDIFLALISGATLCLPDESISLGSDRVLTWIDREGITLLHAVPTLVQEWLGAVEEGVSLRDLRWIFFAGEPLTDVLVQQWRRAFPKSGKIVNLYGPTETTLAKCFHVVPDGMPPPGIQYIGKPLPQTQALILNPHDALCGVGEPGEMVIRTPFRTAGYINEPEQQHRKFVRNTFRNDPADVVYRTGDIGRYRMDGTIEFLGRCDDQVKIRGTRIEPAEINAVLIRNPKVKASFVTAWGSQEEEYRLVAYVVANAGTPASGHELREFLREHLPPAMIPSAFVFLDAMPFTTNGKVNRRALPPPDFQSTETPHPIPPHTPVERSLADVWCFLLRLKKVGVRDNFFDLGGHSLLATRLMSRIWREFNVELPLQVIFANPTIESLAIQILRRQAGVSGGIEDLLAEVESLSDEAAENQLWELDRNETGRVAANAAAEGVSRDFCCPSTRSPLFGRRRCNLVILVNDHFDPAQFRKVATLVQELDPAINATVVSDSNSGGLVLPQLPTMVFSPAAIRHPLPQHGRVFAGYPYSKSEEYAAMAESGIPVPDWALLAKETTPDLSAFDEYVVRKPDYGGMSAAVRIVRKSRVRWRPITTRVAGTSDSIIVQRFIYTGVRPVSYRVNTLFGRVLYAARYEASEDRPPLRNLAHLPDATAQSRFTISASAYGSRRDLTFDEEIIRMGERAHTAFPEIPLLGFDIVREIPSGKLYVLEANAIGYTWAFPSSVEDGTPLERQFDGVRKAAYILAEKTQEYAS